MDSSTLRKGLLLAAAIPSFLIGLFSLLLPFRTAEIVGFGELTPLGRSEIITFYGGFYLGIALFLTVAVLRAGYRRAAFVAIICTGFPALMARIAAILTERPADATVYLLLCAEVLYSAVGTAGLLLPGDPDTP